MKTTTPTTHPILQALLDTPPLGEGIRTGDPTSSSYRLRMQFPRGYVIMPYPRGLWPNGSHSNVCGIVPRNTPHIRHPMDMHRGFIANLAAANPPAINTAQSELRLPAPPAPAPSTLQLEEGKCYVRRDGKATWPLKFRHNETNYPFFDRKHGETYSKEGHQIHATVKSPKDIIREATPDEIR